MSQFYLSNSDAQGNGGTTNTELISPTFSLAGYTNATLSFWHYYRGYFNGTVTVEISADGGGSYVVLPGASWTTASQGTPSNFVNVVLDLGIYINQTNLKIRFKYTNANWAWYWAVDNVKVTGSATSPISWSPTAGLFTNLAATIPYTGGVATTVYAKPSTTTIYTASADSAAGCTSFTNVTVNVTPTPTTATNTSTQSVCNLSGALLSANTPTIGTGSWSVVSGPSLLASQFSSLTNPTATFTANGGVGAYVVRWSIGNSPCTASTADATITVNAAPTPATNTSTQSVCSVTAVLAGNIPTTGTGSWSVVSGPSLLASQFSSVTNPTATFTAAGGAGAYVVRWTISNSPCTASFADATITVTAFTGGIASSSQNICYGAPANLTVSGFSGTIVKWQYSTSAAFTAPVDIAVTTATLTSAQMGVLVSRRYYRVVVTNGTCTAFSTVVTITISKATWDGATWDNTVGPDSSMIAQFDADYTSIGDLSACSVFVNGGAVTFASNHTLTVQNDVRMVSGSLTFENNSSLVQVNIVSNLGAPVINTGNITYKRNTTPVRAFDYTYWSSPVTPQTLFNLSPLTSATRFYIWDAAAAVPNWVSVSSSTLMEKGKGYILRAPTTFDATVPAVYNGSFFGVPNTGTVTIPVYGGSAQMNLLGNPYPSALSAISFLSLPSNVTTLEGTIYFWTHNTLYASGVYVASDYAVYNYTGSTATAAAAGPGVSAGVIPNGKIASGQGFFIKGLASGNATYTNTMRVPAGANNNNQFFRSADTPAAVTTIEDLERHRIWLDVSNSNADFKQLLVGYVATATNGIDRGFDGDMVDGSPLTFYSALGGKKLSIQGRSLPFDVTDTVPLGYKSTAAGSYTISLSHFDGLFDTQDIYLEDTVLNVVHNLKTANYTFATETGTFESRFILRYTPGSTLEIVTPSFNENTVVVYKNEQGLHINTGSIAMASVAIYDLRGRLLASQKNIGMTTTSFVTLPTTQQVLLVKITSQEGAAITKKVIY